MLPARERVRPGGTDQHATLCGSVAKGTADLAHFDERVGYALVYAGRGLEHGRQQLLPHALVPRLLRDLAETWNELVALRREELKLFLDTKAEGRAAAEVHFHDVGEG